jgi:hypothetical protein
VNRHQCLARLHAAYRPRNYLEIGVNNGRSLTLSRVRSIAIDPDFAITSEVACDLRLVKATSDDYFAQPDPVAPFDEKVIDFAFIDGMHLFEFALRDFMNVERHAAPTSMVVFDDMLPRTVDEAARDRHTTLWTGDVFKVALVLERYRPDLICIPLNTQPTGLLLVLGLDPTNTTLAEHYDEIIDTYVDEDPQTVPPDVLERRRAVWPKRVLGADFWEPLITLRDRSRGSADRTAGKVRRLYAEDAVLAQWASGAPERPSGRRLLARH